jgi:hypothetical protein
MVGNGKKRKKQKEQWTWGHEFRPREMVEDTDGACDGRQMENACIFVVSSSAPESERGVLFPVEVGSDWIWWRGMSLC